MILALIKDNTLFWREERSNEDIKIKRTKQEKTKKTGEPPSESHLYDVT